MSKNNNKNIYYIDLYKIIKIMNINYINVLFTIINIEINFINVCLKIIIRIYIILFIFNNNNIYY